MRGFAVAAGGWDEVEPGSPTLRLVTDAAVDEVADEVADEDRAAPVIDLGAHRVVAGVPEGRGIILAW